MPQAKNRFKPDSTKKNPRQGRTKSVFASGANRIGRLGGLSIRPGRRTLTVIGLISVLTSLVLLLAFVSYLFTWKEDQSVVADSGMGELIFGEKPEVRNWLGLTGAKASHYFFHKAFGIASFFWIIWLLLAGLRLSIRVRPVSLSLTLAHVLFLNAFVSLFFGFLYKVFPEIPYYLAGAFGYFLNQWFNEVIGVAGTSLLLVFAFLGYIVIAFDADLTFSQTRASLRRWLGASERTNLMENEKNQDKEQEEDLDSSEGSAEAAEEQEEEGDPSEFADKEFSGEELQPVIGQKPSAPVNPETLEVTVEETPEERKATEVPDKSKPDTQYDPTLELSKYRFPPLDLLKAHGNSKVQLDPEELEANKNRIVETLGHYNIEIAKIKATIGPTITLYEIIPVAGVRISKIKNLEDDIALSLAAKGIRIIAPIPGKGTIGIEVPNRKPEIVSLRALLDTEKFQETHMELPIALGKTISNEVYIADLAKMPHLLIAGATGQGKSVGINDLLVSLLYKMHPARLKLVLVDPKKVELSLYKKLQRHFLAWLPDDEEEPIICDTKRVVYTLNSLTMEMDQRYNLLKEAHVRNLKEYNVKFEARRLNPEDGHRFLPYIVVVVDEFADLIMTAGKEVEGPIARLAQLARAVGIHLVLATQRPSVNIITGSIKANFPARIAYRVTAKVDSRTILDTGGADQLIGKGDMLLSQGSELVRLQCAFVDTPEVEAVCDYIGDQQGFANQFLLPEYKDESGDGGGEIGGMEDRDPLFREAAGVVVQHQQGSTSLIQRRLKVGYNRAGRIMDQLEAHGIVGPFEGSKAREVLYSDAYALEQYFTELDSPEAEN